MTCTLELNPAWCVRDRVEAGVTGLAAFFSRWCMVMVKDRMDSAVTCTKVI